LAGARSVSDGRIRLDKWLWQARFVKSRSLSAGLIEAGHMRLNGERVVKPAHPVGPGDVLTFPAGGKVRVVRILAVGVRRGPATEAQTLYRNEGADAVPPGPPAPE
jgi:ribosome-associated heat shock protein Hsp15